MAPLGGSADTRYTMHGSPVLLQEENFSTWKHAFAMAATAHGWMSYYTSPFFEDPRVLTQTMAALQVAMDAELLRQPQMLQHTTAHEDKDASLVEQNLHDSLRRDALRQHKFRELHAHVAAEFQVQARLFISSSLSHPLQLAVQSIECPYRMYTFLQDRFEHDAMDSLDVLRLLLAPIALERPDERILSFHFDRIDILLGRFQSKIIPPHWAAMSTADYHFHVWTHSTPPSFATVSRTSPSTWSIDLRFLPEERTSPRSTGSGTTSTANLSSRHLLKLATPHHRLKTNPLTA
ncbi:hypothetical protein H310_01711 [Aphanomyces invadans]|uniref:Uncharacterized protein n=1 Tax=Aphanomyces invadans TaxID=157072 RepID=A0A024UTQ1_9STRA|nr:hypothetical protein H310_01711 [Aphanomyces invadans]ETW09335.1 hypothetical protein H310_01711 [Aphanomyces invadans]|eukprot:XP_008863140.1 hypothetical protein H310_01711 [Aphanomyces invadans]